jgi:hypothetical protein
MTAFGLRDGPVHVLDDDEGPLPGHYEIEVWAANGEPQRRFLTDKGRAEMLRLMDDGRREISEQELHDLTTEPDLATLLARMDREAGEGA